jgi:ribosomal protein S27E
MLRVNVADVTVTYRTVEVPEVCPMCGGRLAAPIRGRAQVRELNLASANFYGAIGRENGEGFVVDTEAGEEHPSDAIWIAYAYECAGCGEILATGTVEAQ